MENINIHTVISISISSLGLIYLAFWRFKELRTDEFRNKIFCLRDELFLYAAKGEVKFDEPAYIVLRNLMNGYIRFSHHFSLMHFIVLQFQKHKFKTDYTESFSKQWEAALVGLNESTKNKFIQFEDEATFHLFERIFLDSYLKKFIAIFSGLGLIVIIKLVLKWIHFAKVTKGMYFDRWVYGFGRRHSSNIRYTLNSLNTDAYIFGRKRFGA